MFSYFGAKRRSLHLYPSPRHATIIEPFAGAANYAFGYFDRDIWINDSNKEIFGVWKYLQQASRHDIFSLPDVTAGDYLHSFQLAQTERNLIALAVNRARAEPGMKISPWSVRGRKSEDWPRKKRWIANNLWRIRHWRVSNLDYKCIPNQEATWFIDPPYQTTGFHYPHHKIDYPHLANWCRERRGQIIVCENDGATWLPFRFLGQVRGLKGLVTECIWTND